MSQPLSDFSALYDWSLLEKGVQDYFISCGGFEKPSTDANKETWAPATGNTALFTAFEALTFQKNRPCVMIDIDAITPMKPQKMLRDSNGMLRPWCYKASLRFEIITEADYSAHASLRATVANLADTIAPLMPEQTENTQGVNNLLTQHIVQLVENSGQSTSITPESGYFVSSLSYQITFAPRPDKWPGGFNQ